MVWGLGFWGFGVYRKCIGFASGVVVCFVGSCRVLRAFSFACEWAVEGFGGP